MQSSLMRAKPYAFKRFASAAAATATPGTQAMASIPPTTPFPSTLGMRSAIKAAQPAQRFDLPEYHAAVSHLISKGLACPNLTWDQRVVWGDHDQFGHVNHVRFIQWFESARAYFFENVFGPESITGGASISMILGQLNVRYRRPVTNPDTVIIGQGAVMPLEKSDRFTLRSTVYSLTQKDIVATADQLCVTYDYQQNKVVEVPEDIKEQLMYHSLPVKAPK